MPGFPGLRIATPIASAARNQAGLTKLDYLVVTHYHGDHDGDVTAHRREDSGRARSSITARPVETDASRQTLYRRTRERRATGRHKLVETWRQRSRSPTSTSASSPAQASGSTRSPGPARRRQSAVRRFQAQDETGPARTRARSGDHRLRPVPPGRPRRPDVEQGAGTRVSEQPAGHRGRLPDDASRAEPRDRRCSCTRCGRAWRS